MYLVRRLGFENPCARLWYISSRAYRSNNIWLAKLCKAINFFIFKALLCYECDLADNIEMVHFGFGCVSHPNVTIGRNVKLFHHVTLAAETKPNSDSRIVIEDGAVIGAYAILLGNDHGGIRIGAKAVIGAGAIVTRDVAPGATVVPLPSRPVRIDETMRYGT